MHKILKFDQSNCDELIDTAELGYLFTFFEFWYLKTDATPTKPELIQAFQQGEINIKEKKNHGIKKLKKKKKVKKLNVKNTYSSEPSSYLDKARELGKTDYYSD